MHARKFSHLISFATPELFETKLNAYILGLNDLEPQIQFSTSTQSSADNPKVIETVYSALVTSVEVLDGDEFGPDDGENL